MRTEVYGMPVFLENADVILPFSVNVAFSGKVVDDSNS